MKRPARIATIIVLPIILLGIGLFLIQNHFESIVKKLIVTEINNNLLVKAGAEEIKFSVWENFPKASLNFINIHVDSPESNIQQKNLKPLVSKGNLSLSFNLFDLISGNYTIQQINIKSAYVNLFALDSINYNYNVWKKENQQEVKGDVSFRIEKIIIEESIINYDSYQSKNTVEATVNKAKLKAKWTGNKISLEGKVDCLAHKILTNFAKFNAVDIVWEGKFYNEGNTWGIETSNGKLIDDKIEVKGLFLKAKTGEKIDLSIAVNKLPLTKIKDNLSSLWPASIRKYKLSGLLSATMKIKGYLNDRNGPLMATSFQFSESTLALETKNKGATDIGLKGDFKGSINNSETFLLKVNEFSAKVEDQSIIGHLDWSGKAPDYLNSHLEGVFDMARLSDFVKLDSVGSINGNINFALDTRIPIGQKYSEDIEQWEISGQIQGNQLNFESFDKAIQLKDMKGILKINENKVKIQDLFLTYRDSKFKINGELNQWNSLIKKTDLALFKGHIHCEKIDVDKILHQGGKGKENKDQDWVIPFGVVAKVTAGNINHKKLNLASLQTKLLVTKNNIILDSLSFTGLNGKGTGKISIKALENGGFNCQINGHLVQIDIKDLFKSFDNFEQQTLQSDHISGKLNATVSFNANYDKQSNINLESIRSLADLKITNGKLKNFSPLFSLSKYISIEELNDISFSELTNTIRIENSKIEFPQMEISSSALNLKVHGIHYFTNKIDYHFSILLSEILNKKFKIKNKNHDEFGEFEEENQTRNEIFVRLSGSVDHPVFSIDKNAMKKSRKEKWQEEKKNIQTLLKNGGQENDLSPKTSFEKSEKMFSIEHEGEEIKSKTSGTEKNKTKTKPSIKEPKPLEKNKTEKKQKKNKDEKTENSDDFN